MKKQNKLSVITLLISAGLLIIACGLPLPKMPGLPGGSATTPWADVPAFPGSTVNANEALGTSLFNQAQAKDKSKMETVILHTDKTPADVAAFYSDKMMKDNGWGFGMDGSADTGCTQDKLEGQPRAICEYFKKDKDGREISLTLDAGADPNGGKNTRIVLVRIAGSLVTQ